MREYIFAYDLGIDLVFAFHACGGSERTVTLNHIFDSNDLKRKMYLFQEVGKPELGFPNHKFIQLCPQGTSPTHNCMNEWLGEPVLVFQLPGRGILRIYINNLVVQRVFVKKLFTS